jgi:hypothetical protein
VSIFTKAFNRLGYDSLVARFPGETRPQGPRWENRCVQFGSMRYDWCVTIVVGQDGLCLQPKPPLQGVKRPVFVPWGEVREVRSTLLYCRRAVRLACGEPAAGTVTVWRPVWDAAAPFRDAARGSGRTAPPDAPGGAKGAPPA